MAGVIGASVAGVIEKVMQAEGTASSKAQKLKPFLCGSSCWQHFRVVLRGDVAMRLSGAQTHGLLAFIVHDMGTY